MTRSADLDFALSVATAAEPERDCLRPVIVPDLVRANGWDQATLVAIRASLAGALADPGVSTADLKGGLNRAAGRAWGIAYAPVYKPREFAEALLLALDQHLGSA